MFFCLSVFCFLVVFIFENGVFIMLLALSMFLAFRTRRSLFFLVLFEFLVFPTVFLVLCGKGDRVSSVLFFLAYSLVLSSSLFVFFLMRTSFFSLGTFFLFRTPFGGFFSLIFLLILFSKFPVFFFHF